MLVSAGRREAGGFGEAVATIGHNFEAVIADLQTRMREAAADLNFEEAVRLGDEIKRLRTTELAVTDDPTVRTGLPAQGTARGSAGPRRQGSQRQGPHGPSIDQMGPGIEAVPGGRPAGRSKIGRPGMRGGFKPRRG